MSWLKLIRWYNLLIIFLTQYLVWVVVIVPERYTFEETGMLLNGANFLLLSVSTVLIAAAGYVINDYFDIKIDTINRPDKVVLGKSIPRKTAISIHVLFNATALLLSYKVANQAGHYEWLLLQVGCIALLWWYSTQFKRQYITGNIVVSLLTALTIIVLGVYEPVLHREMGIALFAADKMSRHTSLPVWVLGVYAYFAFMLTWMREIVKDMEDYKGDAEEGCVTMPVKKGLQFSKHFTGCLELLVLAPLAASIIVLVNFHYLYLAAYIGILLIMPLIVWWFIFSKNNTVESYHNASSGLKWIMLSGVISLIVYRVQMLIRFGK